VREANENIFANVLIVSKLAEGMEKYGVYSVYSEAD
jgi:hypothetical protein